MIRPLVPAVQEPRPRLARAHALNRVHRSDDPTLRLAPIGPQRTQVDDQRDLRRVVIRHSVRSADELEGGLRVRRVQRRGEGDAVPDSLEDLSHRRAADIARSPRSLGDLRYHEVAAARFGEKRIDVVAVDADGAYGNAARKL